MNQITINNNTMPVLYGCDFYVAQEPFFHPDRILDFNVLIYVTEGIIYVTEEDTDYTVSAGELLFLKAGLHHYGKKETPVGTRWHFIHFYTKNMTGQKNFVPDHTPAPQYDTSEFDITLPKKLSYLSKSSLEKQIAAYTDYFHSTDTKKRWYLNVNLFDLLSEIAFYNGNHDQSLPLSDEIAFFLEKNACEPFHAEILEKKFHLSYKYMAFTFKKEKNQTMQQYHTMMRMNIACRLLKSTLLSIGEISSKIGYTDMLYFSRCFHREIGCSPTEYRKKSFMLSTT